MCSAMTDASQQDGLSIRSTSEIFCSNISSGLHAAAQPLTVLRVSLEKSRIDGMSLSEILETATSSAFEVERVCMIFNYMQKLVVTDSKQPNLSSVLIRPLIAEVTEGVNLLFENDGMFLKSAVPDAGQT